MTNDRKSSLPSVAELERLRKRFRAALALAGMSQEEFADDYGCGADHLSLVLHGRRKSAPLIAGVVAFVNKHLKGVAA